MNFPVTDNFMFTIMLQAVHSSMQINKDID
jgi:hypothetical protein